MQCFEIAVILTPEKDIINLACLFVLLIMP